MTDSLTTRRGPSARLRAQPPRVLLVAGLATLAFAAAGIVGGRMAAPHAADASVDVAPLTSPPTGDPIVRPEPLELPR